MVIFAIAQLSCYVWHQLVFGAQYDVVPCCQVKVDAKTKSLLDEHKKKKKDTQRKDSEARDEEEGETKGSDDDDNDGDVDESALIEDEVAKTGLDAIMREYADDLVKDVPGGNIYFSFIRVRTTLVLGYWVLGDIHRYCIVFLLGIFFRCDTQYDTDQTAVSTIRMFIVCPMHCIGKDSKIVFAIFRDVRCPLSDVRCPMSGK